MRVCQQAVYAIMVHDAVQVQSCSTQTSEKPLRRWHARYG